jgi:enoyl-CoA hydratase/carnithine racemase
MPEYCRLEEHEGWVEIVINRPDRRNSFIPPLAGEITEMLSSLESRKEVASIILRGEEGYFCSGIDLKALQQEPPPDWMGKETGEMRAMHLALYHCTKPIIACLERFAINAGASLAFACDLIIAGDTAFLQIGEVRQGAGIPMNAAWLKIKASEFVTARLALLGDRVTSKDLLALGLITECVEDIQVLDRCREMATELATHPIGATSAIKRSIVAQRGILDPDDFFPTAQADALKHAPLLGNK